MSNKTQHLDSIDQLQESLQEKDELIEALTTRLEETFGELDRIHRSGGKGGKSVGGGLPTDLVEQQAHLADQLGEAVEIWNAAQPVEQLSRIEEGIQQILSSICSGDFKPVSSAISKPAAVSRPASSASPAAAAAKPVADPEDFWAATKARLMGEAPPKPSEASSPKSVEVKPQVESLKVSTLPPATPVQTPSEGFATEVIPFDSSNDLPAPEPVADNADQLSLLEAIEDRDEYIAYLTGRLRNEQLRKVGVIDWDALSKQPKDLADQLRELEKMLNSQLKEAEISISLERASIARQRGKLFQVKRHLEQEIKRIGNKEITSEEANEKSESRWSKLFNREK